MKARLLKLWDDFRSGFWFLPSLIVLAACVAAFVVPLVDSYLTDWTEKHANWLATTTEAARNSLPMLATGMISAAGVVFSVTIVSLSFASSQFGSRILRSFVSHTITQVAIGTVVATSVYCLLVLRTVQDNLGAETIPHLSVMLGLVAGVASLILLIVFIHHVAISVQAQYIVSELSAELDGAITRLYPEKLSRPSTGSNAARVADDAAVDGDGCRVASDVEGYIQAIDEEGLLEAAIEHDLVIELLARPGDFIQRGTELAAIRPKPKDFRKLEEAVNQATLVGSRRTPRQDVLCTVLELVEVAVRALSTSINDPFTAIAVVDRLSASLGRLAERHPPQSTLCDKDGHPRVVFIPTFFPQVLDAAFHQIRQYGITAPAVTIRLMEGLQHVAAKVQRHEDAEAIERHAQMLIRGADRLWQEPNDRQDLQRRFNNLRFMNLRDELARQFDSSGNEQSPDRMRRPDRESDHLRRDARVVAHKEPVR